MIHYLGSDLQRREYFVCIATRERSYGVIKVVANEHTLLSETAPSCSIVDECGEFTTITKTLILIEAWTSNAARLDL